MTRRALKAVFIDDQETELFEMTGGATVAVDQQFIEFFKGPIGWRFNKTAGLLPPLALLEQITISGETLTIAHTDGSIVFDLKRVSSIEGDMIRFEEMRDGGWRALIGMRERTGDPQRIRSFTMVREND